jgi:hypothetical protein
MKTIGYAAQKAKESLAPFHFERLECGEIAHRFVIDMASLKEAA